jgi:hypothetical protein
VTKNVIVLDTLRVIAPTSYVFELLIWLKTVKQNSLKYLHFFHAFDKGREARTTQHIEHLKAEASFFDAMDERDDPMPMMRALQEQPGKKSDGGA